MARRKRNKKKHSAGFIFPTPLASILMLITLLSLGYLWLNARCEAAGKRIKMLEQERVELRNRVLNEELKWTDMKSLRNLQSALNRHQIVMTWPSEDRVIRVPRPNRSLERDQPAQAEEYAKVTGTYMNE